mmetsp:Transcript_77822/g.231846  ORF Transcript_77822/g.231846 Transcript_77822/m.231846 type:complete len:262 (-) Transcript_77822:147-932(-)
MIRLSTALYDRVRFQSLNSSNSTSGSTSASKPTASATRAESLLESSKALFLMLSSLQIDGKNSNVTTGMPYFFQAKIGMTPFRQCVKMRSGFSVSSTPSKIFVPSIANAGSANVSASKSFPAANLSSFIFFDVSFNSSASLNRSVCFSMIFFMSTPCAVNCRPYDSTKPLKFADAKILTSKPAFRRPTPNATTGCTSPRVPWGISQTRFAPSVPYDSMAFFTCCSSLYAFVPFSPAGVSRAVFLNFRPTQPSRGPSPVSKV